MPRICTLATILVAMFGLIPQARSQIFLHYGFDNNYLDDSSNANHGTLEDIHTVGNAVFTTGTQGTDYFFGTHGWFSGNASDKVVFSTPFTPTNGEPWTVSFWFDMGPIGGGGGTGTPLFSDADGNNTLNVRADALNGAFVKIAGQNLEWEENLAMNRSGNHYAIVANGSGVDLDGIPGDDALVLYFNGNPITPDAGFDLTNVLTNVVFDNIGDGVQSDATSSEEFRGAIGLHDELWIFQAALTGDEVQTLFQSNTPPDFSTAQIPEPQSIAVWAVIGLCLAGVGYFRLRRKN